GVVAVVIGLVWVGRRWSPTTIRNLQIVTVTFLLVALAAALLLVVFPEILAWLHHAAQPHAGSKPASSDDSNGVLRAWAAAGGLVGIAAALAGVFVPAWKALGSLESNKSAAAVTGLFAKAKPFLLSLLTALAAPLLFGAVLLAFMHQGSEHSVIVSGTSQ